MCMNIYVFMFATEISVHIVSISHQDIGMDVSGGAVYSKRFPVFCRESGTVRYLSVNVSAINAPACGQNWSFLNQVLVYVEWQ